MLPLIFYPDPILSKVCKKIDKVDEEIKKFCDDLIKTMYALGGQGLSAPQVNELRAIFVIRLGEKNHQVFINPNITEFGGEKIKVNEGCLSIPTITANLHCRNENIIIEALNPDGDEIKLMLNGVEAVAAQHEFDHLQGTTMFSRMGQAQRTLKKNKYMKWWRKWQTSQKKLLQ